MYSKQLSFLILFIAILLGYSCKNKESKMVEKKVYSKPNLIYILADDLGYGGFKYIWSREIYDSQYR